MSLTRNERYRKDRENSLKKSGFTLVELLIYIAIFSVVGGIMLGILSRSIRSNQAEVATDEVTSQLNTVLTTIQNQVTQSSNLEVYQDTNHLSSSTSTGSYLELRMSSTSTDPTCIYLNNNAVYMVQGQTNPSNAAQCNAGDASPITTSQVVVNNLTFTKITIAGGHASVSISAQITYNTTNPEFAISKTLQSAIGRVSAATFGDNLLPNADDTFDVGQISPNLRWRNGNFAGTVTVGTGSSGGDLGIGTEYPQTNLQVGGVVSPGSGEATNKGLIQINGSGNLESTAGLEFKSSSYQSGFGWKIVAPDLGSGNVPLIIGTRVNTSTWTAVAQISNNGYVGIGTTNPVAKLDVTGGDIKTSSILAGYDYNGTSTSFSQGDNYRTVYIQAQGGGYSPSHYVLLAKLHFVANGYSGGSIRGRLYSGASDRGGTLTTFDLNCTEGPNTNATCNLDAEGTGVGSYLFQYVANDGGSYLDTINIYYVSAWYTGTYGTLETYDGQGVSISVWSSGMDVGTSAPSGTALLPNNGWLYSGSRIQINGSLSNPSVFGNSDYGQLHVEQSAAASGDISKITFGAGYANNGSPEAAIGVMFDGSGSHMYFGTSNNYGSGVTNAALAINPDGTVDIGQTGTEFGALSVNGPLAVEGVDSNGGSTPLTVFKTWSYYGTPSGNVTVTINKPSYGSVSWELVINGYQGEYYHGYGTYYVNNGLYGSNVYNQNYAGGYGPATVSLVSGNEVEITVNSSSTAVYPVAYARITSDSGGGTTMSSSNITLTW